MARILTGEALAERREQEENAAWMRAVWRGSRSPLVGVTPLPFEIAPGVLVIRRREYLALRCSRCTFVDNYLTWDKRLSVKGPGHRELNRWLCQRCMPEWLAWLKVKPRDVHVTAWLDLPDDGLAAWQPRRESDECVKRAA